MAYPFGQLVLPRPPIANGQRRAFGLGAYPSALHVAWNPPAPYRPIQAIAVDNEPEPFWDGANEVLLVGQWMQAVHFEEVWGAIAPACEFNGRTGRQLDVRYLRPLCLTREQTWITDCLDTYRLSVGGAGRIADTYAPFAQAVHLPAAILGVHPSEAQIIQEALANHLPRLATELATAAPSLVFTLGNAALAVMRHLVQSANGAELPSALSSNPATYGIPVAVLIGGRRANWSPLAHPAAPTAYQAAHDVWIAAQPPCG